jgi:hypothetical protein
VRTANHLRASDPYHSCSGQQFSRLLQTGGNIGDQFPHLFTNRPILTPSNPAHGSCPPQSRSPSPDRPQFRPGSPEAAARGTTIYVYAPDGWRHVSKIEYDDLRAKLEEYPVFLCHLGFSDSEKRDRYKGVMESKDATQALDENSEISPNRGCIHCRVKKQGGHLQTLHACRRCQNSNRACAIDFQHQGVPSIGFLPLRKADMKKKQEVTIRRDTWQDGTYWCVDPDKMTLPEYGDTSRETS